MLSALLIAVIVTALAFDFINGFHDTANSIATSVSTRVLSPRQAIIMAALLNFAGAFLSTGVAETIAKGIVKTEIDQYVILAALISAIIWDLITWHLAIPSSSSHALIGSLVGASIAYSAALNIVNWAGVWNKVVLPLITSPVIGFIIGYVIMSLLFELLRRFSQRFVNKWFSKLQILSAAFMALSHGQNDSQKTMGIITLALISSGFLGNNANIPIWVMAACGFAMALGTSVGGWKIIKTMGVNMIKLQPIGGFAAETSAAAVIQVMTALKSPVSTTHVISASIMGVGAAKRFSAIRWVLARKIVSAWILTIPCTMIIAAGITLLFKYVFGM